MSEHVIDQFFKKSPVLTSHETLATLREGNLEAGYRGVDAQFFTHVNYYTMRKAIDLLGNTGPVRIVETGCASNACKSTLLWDKVAQIHGGRVLSVDLDGKSVTEANRLTSSHTTVTQQDSVAYLKTLKESIDLLYLDSYDLEFHQPANAAFHGWKEFQACRHLLHPGSVVVIDDTPLSGEWLDHGRYHPVYPMFRDIAPIGKGSLVAHELARAGAKLVLHQYQMVWQIPEGVYFTDVSKLM